MSVNLVNDLNLLNIMQTINAKLKQNFSVFWVTHILGICGFFSDPFCKPSLHNWTIQYKQSIGIHNYPIKPTHVFICTVKRAIPLWP